jgi:predicted component of type VI protein secretion system
MPCLTIHFPGVAPVSHVLKDETTTVGRMKGNSIVIEDASISLMHARITRRNGEYFLKDLNSTNGTLVNGQPVTEARLRDQDRLRFADVNTTFELAEAVAPVASASGPVVAATPSGANPGPHPTAAAKGGLISVAPSAHPATLTSETAPLISTKRKMTHRPLIAACVAAVFAVVATATFLLLRGNSRFASSPIEAKTVTTLSKSTANTIPNQPIVPALPEKQLKEEPAATESVSSPVDSIQRIADLASLLKTGDVDQRRQAAAALHGLTEKPEGAEPALLEALRDSDSDVKMWAALTLVKNQVYNSNCIPVLINGLHHEDPVVRQVVCLSLGLIPYEPADKAVVGAALAETSQKDSDPEVRTMAQSALGVIAPELVQTTPAQTGTSNP